MDVLIVDSLNSEVLHWLEARHRIQYSPELVADPVALMIALAAARTAILPPSTGLDAAMLKRSPHLRVVARLAVGVENIDLEACSRMGIQVVRPATASATAEAEFAVGALLNLLRRVPIVNDEGLLIGRELGSCTVGLLGMTPTVAPLAKLLRAFGAKVLGYDPGVHTSDLAWSRNGVEAVGLRDLIVQSDAVAVLLVYYSRYKGLLGERLLQSAKHQQVIVSLGHGSLFDEAALAKALTQGPLSAAWLDSLEPGALDPERPLYRASTLQVTPRVGGVTQGARLRGAWAVAQRIDEYLVNNPLPTRSASDLPKPTAAGSGPAESSALVRPSSAGAGSAGAAGSG